MAPSGERFSALDGVRGWAAFCVLLFHVFFEMFRAIHPIYASPVLFPLMNGNLAVMVFFVLSGHVLSVGFMKTRNVAGLKNLVVKRYPRLAIPVFLSCMIVFLCMIAGWTANHDASVIVKREDWLGSWLRFSPDIKTFFKEVLFNTFFMQEKPLYNRFLWTMFYELFGSALVFMILFFYRWLERPLLVLCAIAVFLLWEMAFLSCFIFGMISSELLLRGTYDKLRSSRAWQMATLAVLPLSYFLIMIAYVTVGGNIQLYALIGFMLIAAVHINADFEKAMNSPLSQYLGRISFPLYLMHFVVIVTVTSWLTVGFGGDGISFVESLFIGVCTVMLSLLAARIFLPVEILTVKGLKALSRPRPLKGGETG